MRQDKWATGTALNSWRSVFTLLLHPVLLKAIVIGDPPPVNSDHSACGEAIENDEAAGDGEGKEPFSNGADSIGDRVRVAYPYDFGNGPGSIVTIKGASERGTAALEAGARGNQNHWQIQSVTARLMG